jgi:long-chain acyl-CoA synthetase
MVGLFSKNRYEWVVAEQACNAYSCVSIPLYDTLSQEDVTYVLQQTGMTTVFANHVKVDTLLKAKTAHVEATAALRNVVQFEDVAESQVMAAAEAGITLYSFTRLLEIGKAHPLPHSPPKPDDVATFCYTSGTTGAPKGAMLTHGNIVAALTGACAAGVALTADDVHLSYLPLAHMFERLVQAAVWLGGGRVGFYQGNTLKLTDDLKTLRPTLFPAVPRCVTCRLACVPPRLTPSPPVYSTRSMTRSWAMCSRRAAPRRTCSKRASPRSSTG